LRTAGNILVLLSLISCLTGSGLLSGAVRLFPFASLQRGSWVPVTGTVTEMRKEETTESGYPLTTYCPTVEYTAGGESHQVELDECAFPPPFQAGDNVELLYNPQNPEQLALKNGLNWASIQCQMAFLGAGGLICMIPGPIGLPMGLLMIWRARRRV
jgi:Protein of unknown function (DUF3592)